MSVGRHNGWEVAACRTLPGDLLLRRNADYRIPWSGGRTLGDRDRMSEAEARSLADAIEAGAREIVDFLRGTAGGVEVRLLDFEREEELRRAPLAGTATAGG